ncbi:MAG: tyrosine--tRNA ligase [Planctomycetes bacterium]|nr:tyrosine--tRNA ligase [Planctomycetota bacterium]
MSNLFDVLKERGFLYQVTDEDAVRRLFDEGTVTAYTGYDPTAESLHVGNLLTIMPLIHLQRAGHRPLAIVGGGTVMVGDPSGKTEMRKMLSRDKIDAQTSLIRGQLSNYLDFDGGKALIENNADWILDLNYIEFLRDIGKHFSVNRMLSFESYKIRLETGLSFLEFNYQILQAYDFLILFRKHGCKLQMGGSDQWGNIVAGTDLIRRLESAEAQGWTYPLLTTASGAKMGKTESGAIWLDRNHLSPYDYYQFWVNVDDRDVEKFLRLYTFLPMDEVRRLGALQGADIREAKQVLAYEATTLTHGKEEADRARDAAKSAFSGDGKADGVPVHHLPMAALEAGVLAVDLFVDTGLSASKSEARRLIKQGGAYVNTDKVPDLEYLITASMLDDQASLMLRAGKKRMVRIAVK